MKLLTLPALFALLAAAEVKLPGNIGSEFCVTWMDTQNDNPHILKARCGTSLADDLELDLNKCVKNDNGKPAWGEE